MTNTLEDTYLFKPVVIENNEKMFSHQPRAKTFSGYNVLTCNVKTEFSYSTHIPCINASIYGDLLPIIKSIDIILRHFMEL